MVYDLTADTIIFRYGERQTMRPASVMKLVTAITALDKLGSNYQFRTSLYYTGQLIGNVLNGDLYCVGGMDPRFNNDDMNAFVERVLGMGVDTIRGRIIGDYSMKYETRLGEGWCWDDDNPILSPLLISKKADFLRSFVDEMRNRDIVVADNFAEGTLPNGAYVVGSRFHAFDQILMQMLKESDNLYAESMFYQIAASGSTRHASAANARTHIKKLISKIGLNPDNYKIADGSGLSLYNYVSPELMVRLLRYAYRNSEIYSSLYPALPIAGEDGTLSKRMKGKYTIGNVRAKTGTLTGVSSLAGYCHTANNHLLAFCIINQGVMKNADGRAFQDAVCTALCQP
jgi:D-alanyl-D-alanine carboxypeptidase/D-alanyl-D-alanine-endopeptidase (penicillin-binding protein 4)